MESLPGQERRPPQPYRRRALRRKEWLAIYLPMALGLVSVVGAGMLLWSGGIGTASLWSDISLIFLLTIVLAMALILLALTVGLAVGLGYAIRWLPWPAQRGRLLAARAEGLVGRGAEWASKPIMVSKAMWAALVAGIRALLSIFRSPGRGMS